MFVKPKIKEVETEFMCLSKDVFVDKNRQFKSQFKIPQRRVSNSKFIPTCHHCGIMGHTRPNCFQIRARQPWPTQNAPMNDEPGFGKQLLVLITQVKLINEKLANLSNCSDLKNVSFITDKAKKDQV
jgi:hypothetical protein